MCAQLTLIRIRSIILVSIQDAYKRKGATMAKLNISISDDLAKRLEPYRDRLNLSRIASDCIEREVAALEAVPDMTRNLEALIAKLRQQKREVGAKSRQMGVEDGMEYAATADYEQFLELDKTNRQGYLLNVINNEIEYAFNFLPEDVRDELRGRADDDIDDLDECCAGWLDGFLGVWEQVRGKL